MLHHKSVFQIIEWLDDKNCTLSQCFDKPKENDYANQEVWSKNAHTSIARCIKGLELYATNPAVKGILQAITDKVTLIQVKLDFQAISNRLYGL